MSIRALKKWALLLTFWVALQTRYLRADQTITGNLTVTGNSDLQGDTLTLGTRTDNSDPGVLTLYTDGTISSLEFDASRAAQVWKWQQNGYTTPLQLQMKLDNNNTLTLYNSSGAAEITLSPTGTSTFANSLTVNGTDNEMPNQTLVNGNSVLTESLGDSRYVLSSKITIGSGVGMNGGTASGVSSFASGTDSSTTSSGYDAVAMGCDTYASAFASVAMGRETKATALFSTAMGNWTTASGGTSTAMGAWTTASGYYSTAMGYGSTAHGENSTAMGFHSTSSGSYSTAMGGRTIASGPFSTAMDAYTTASGSYSMASGYQSIASGLGSTATGNGTTASGNDSTASGLYTTAEAYLSYVVGTHNVGGGSATAWVATDPLLELGNGTSGAPSDALVVYKNGNAAVQGSVTTGGAINAGGIITAQPGGNIPMYTGE